jgi:hypothetical protein
MQALAFWKAVTDDQVVRRFAHSLDVSQPGSDLRVQFQTEQVPAAVLARLF